MAVAEISPRTRGPERVKPIAKDLLRLEMAVSAIYEKLKRAQSVVAQKANQSPTFEQTLDAALEAYLDHHDPLRKAERVTRRLATRRVASPQRNPMLDEARAGDARGVELNGVEPKGSRTLRAQSDLTPANACTLRDQTSKSTAAIKAAALTSMIRGALR